MPLKPLYNLSFTNPASHYSTNVASMKSMDGHEEHDALVAQLTSGFAAMLEQVQELARRNTELEQRIARFQKEVGLSFLTFDAGACYDEET